MSTCGNFKVDASNTREYKRLCPFQGIGDSHVFVNKQLQMTQMIIYRDVKTKRKIK